jgi:hypothetical protein
VNTPLPTPHGWTTIGEIRVGDLVFDERGEPCRVLAKSKVETEPTYRLTFSDGATIIAGARHQWVTSTYTERLRKWKGSDEFRARRRASRPSRSLGTRSAKFVAALSARNSRLAKSRNLPTEGIRSTEEIARTLKVGERLNHSIRIAGALRLAEADLLVPPYALGAWLGDGTTNGGSITGVDDEIFQEVANSGYEITRYSFTTNQRGVLGLRTQLKQLGVFGNKHIPPAYLRASVEQRLALLQGLMDTDGTCSTKGYCEIILTSRRLIEDIGELLSSLGIKARLREGVAKLHGRTIGPKYRLKFITELPVFRLARKLIRQKRSEFRGTHAERYIVSADLIESVPLQCIKVDSPSHCYLAGRQMIPTHNSDALILDALGLAHGAIHYQGYRALLIRETFPELRELIDRTRQIYPAAVPGAVCVDNEWRFPSGAKVFFGYCERDSDVYQYQGQQFQWIGIDELSHFATPYRWTYLSSRLRSPENALPCYMRATTNPGPKWIADYWQIGKGQDESNVTVEVDGRSFRRRFIPSRLQDNPYLLNTGYEQRLKLLPDVERRALLEGEWGVIEVPGAYYADEMRKARADGRIGKVPHESRLPVHTIWDLGVGDSTAIVFLQVNGAEKRLIDYYEATGEGFAHYAKVLADRGYNYGKHIAPHDIEVRNLGVDAQSRKQIAAGLGIKFEVAPNLTFDDGINAVRMTLGTCWFDEVKCARLVECLEHYRKAYNSRMGEFMAREVHDQFSHAADAARYMCVSLDMFGSRPAIKDPYASFRRQAV